MKTYLSAALVAALVLGGCAAQNDASKQQAGAAPAANVATADQAAPVKKKCSNQTGSRLAPCGEGSTTDAVQGTGGDDYRNSMMGKSVGGVKPQ